LAFPIDRSHEHKKDSLRDLLRPPRTTRLLQPRSLASSRFLSRSHRAATLHAADISDYLGRTGGLLLILDDFGLVPLGAAQRKELLEVLDDRYQLSSTVLTSQLEPKDWHAVIGDATLADAICDRLVHNAHRLKLGGESIRKAESLTGAKKAAK
jgi:hypothetical protein